MQNGVVTLPDFEFSARVSILAQQQCYNHILINLPKAWEISKGAGTSCAVLDTGVASHRDLPVKSSQFHFSPETAVDRNGHGTFVAGQIGARGSNGMGVVGVAPDTELKIGAVLDARGNGGDYDLCDGLDWARDRGVDVINMSLGMSSRAPLSRKLERACERAVSAGVTVIAASGNEGSALGQPAVYDCTIAVGAVDRRKNKAPFSNRGKKLDFVCGGVDAYGLGLRDDYVKMSGTSMAAPILSGIALLIISEHKARGEKLTPAQVKAHIRKMAFDLGPRGYDTTYGYGIPVFGHVSAQTQVTPSWWERALMWLGLR